MHFLTISCGQAFNEQRCVIRSQEVKQFSEHKRELVFQKLFNNFKIKHVYRLRGVNGTSLLLSLHVVLNSRKCFSIQSKTED